MSTTDEMRRVHQDDPAPTDELDRPATKEQRDWSLLRRLAIGVVGAAAGMYLLRLMGSFLQPVLMALLLCYALWPLHAWLRRFVKPWVSLVILGFGLGLIVVAIGWATFANAEEFWQDLPRYRERAGHLLERARDHAGRFLPESWLPRHSEPPRMLKEGAAESAREVFGAFAGFLAQAGLVALYVIFMMLEAERFPRAIRRAFPNDRSDRILEVINSINEAVIEYLSIKVKINVLVTVPAMVLMIMFGVEGAILWGVVTFFARFVPYLGVTLAYVLPVASAALQFESPARTIFFAITLLVLYIIAENWLEPVLTGKAVGLSPLVVLLALAFWELVWGIVGMILAVPLMVILKIVMARLDPTRPFARLLADED